MSSGLSVTNTCCKPICECAVSDWFTSCLFGSPLNTYCCWVYTWRELSTIWYFCFNCLWLRSHRSALLLPTEKNTIFFLWRECRKHTDGLMAQDNRDWWWLNTSIRSNRWILPTALLLFLQSRPQIPVLGCVILEEILYYAYACESFDCWPLLGLLRAYTQWQPF